MQKTTEASSSLRTSNEMRKHQIGNHFVRRVFCEVLCRGRGADRRRTFIRADPNTVGLTLSPGEQPSEALFGERRAATRDKRTRRAAQKTLSADDYTPVRTRCKRTSEQHQRRIFCLQCPFGTRKFDSRHRTDAATAEANCCARRLGNSPRGICPYPENRA